MLPALMLAAATLLPLAGEVRIENGVRVHHMMSAPTDAASPEPSLQVRIDPGYRGTELYTPNRFEMRFRNSVPVIYVLDRTAPF